MGFTLSWKNRGTLASDAKVEIFRFTSPPDVNNITGAPLATVTDINVTTYVDTTCLLGATYYYVLRTTSGARTAISTPKMVTIAEDLGPGPTKLMYGDRNFGFFGLVPAVHVLIGTSSQTLYKFVYNGRILYVDIANNTPSNILGINQVSGGVIPYGLTSGNAFTGETKVLINSNGRLFRARVPKLYSRDNTVVSFGTKLLSEIDFGISEALDLYRFLFTKNVTSWSGPGYPVNNSAITGSAIMTSDAASNITMILLQATTKANTTITTANVGLSSGTQYTWLRVFEYFGNNPADVPAY